MSEKDESEKIPEGLDILSALAKGVGLTEPSSDFRNLAQMNFEFYQAHKMAGFSSVEALQFAMHQWTTLMMMNTFNPPPEDNK
jgi:hypothetical protein